MLKKTVFRLSCLAAMVSVLFIAQAQTEDQGWKKTVTLSSGEVVCDLSGKWDLEWQPRGQLVYMIGRVFDIIEISQQEGSFKGIRLIGNQWNPKGLAFEGELDKNGISKLKYYAKDMEGSYKARLSKDGNEIEWSGPEWFISLTRK